MNKKQQILDLLAKNYGKIFSVRFVKRTTGEVREMVCRQGVVNGTTPLVGGEFANGTAGKAIDHDLILVTDINLEKAGKHSRRSLPIENIRELRAGGEILKFEE